MKIASSYRVKFVLLGDSNVGKTTCCHLFANNELDDTVSATIGIGFATKTIVIDNKEFNNDNNGNNNGNNNNGNNNGNNNNGNCNNNGNNNNGNSKQELIIQIWDTAGQQRFENLLKSYLRDTCIGIFVFDLTNRESFDHLDKWKEQLDSMNSNDLMPMYIIVGTKSDLRDHQVSHYEIEEKANEWKCKYYVISCVQNNSYDMIYRIFYNSAKEFHQKMIQAEINNLELPRFVINTSFISLTPRINKKKSCC